MRLTGQDLPRITAFSQDYGTLLGVFKTAHGELLNQSTQPRLLPVGLQVGRLEDDEHFEVKCAGWTMTIRFNGVLAPDGSPRGRVSFHEKASFPAGSEQLIDSVDFGTAGLSSVFLNARQHEVSFVDRLPAMVLATAEQLLWRRAQPAPPVA